MTEKGGEYAQGTNRVSKRQQQTANVIIGAELDAAKRTLGRLLEQRERERELFLKGRGPPPKEVQRQIREAEGYVRDLNNILTVMRILAEKRTARIKRDNKRRWKNEKKTRNANRQLSLPNTEGNHGHEHQAEEGRTDATDAEDARGGATRADVAGQIP